MSLRLRAGVLAAALLLLGGTGAAGQASPDAIRPFTIRVPDSVLTDLKTRLANARIPEPLQGDGWTHGTDIHYLRELVAYWRNGFDWRSQERRLNQLEQFTMQIALLDSPHVAGLHINMCFGAAPAGTDPNAGLTERKRERLKERQAFQAEETGYQQIQGTKPQTLGIALNDSPAGLAAWIVEKFRTWCDCNGNPETVFTKDELLTNITL